MSPTRPDEVTSVFGIPRLAEDDTLRAVRAACEVHLVLPALNQELERRFGITLGARVGVDAGTVVVDEAHARSIASSAAARGATSLTRLARAGETLVGERAYDLVRHAVRVEPLEREVDRTPPLRRLIDVLPNVRARPLRPRSPLVGRRWETESLAETFDRVAAARTCRLFTLVGPPGIGKSRIAQEFTRSVASRSVVLRGVCVESAPTYSPLLEVVRQAAAVDPTDSPERVLEKIAALLDGDDDADAVAVAVAGLFDIADLPVDVESRSRDVRRLLEAVAAEIPLVVVFDDIHRAKAAFLQLLGSIAEQSFGAPLLMLCLAWPELDDRHPRWSENIPNATRIRLEPLDDPDSGALIENLLGAEAVDVLRDRVTEAADGNPLFVEELIAMLVDRALIEPRDGMWVPTGELPRDFPATVEAVVATRLDALSDDERTVVRAAAVEGVHFHVGAVGALTAEELDGTVSSALAALARKDLVRRDRAELPGDDAFRFRHIVIRDVA